MSVLLTIAATLFIVLFSYCWYCIYVQRKKLQWMPGEEGLPFIGVILDLKENTGK